MQHHFHGGSIDVPEGWLDRSIHSFVEVGGDGTAAKSLVIHNAPRMGVTLDDFMDQELVRAAQRLPEYRLERRRTVAQGREVVYSWRTPEGTVVQQRQLYAERSPDTVHVVTLTSTSPDATRLEPLWSRLLASLEIGQARG